MFIKRLLSLNYKFAFLRPNFSEVIIFDKTGSDEIKKHIIDESISYKIYDYTCITIYLNLFFIAQYFFNIFKFCKSINSLPRDLYITYIATELQILNPKVIITFNDENIIYHKLIDFLPNIKFFAIQNGLRENYHKKHRIHHEIKHDYYFCFGEHDIKKHRANKWILRKPFPIGSLRAGIALEKYGDCIKKYDICLLSEYFIVKNIVDKKWIEFSRLVNKSIAQFYKKNDIKLIIALRDNSDDEREYFNSLFGKGVSYSVADSNYRNYKSVLESKLTIGFASTLLLESLALNTKVLSIDPSGCDDYFDFDNNIRYKYSNYDDLEKKISELIMEPYSVHKNNVERSSKSAMNLDENNLPHIFIKNMVKKSISDVL